jgi:hypothetical protein
MKRVSLLICSLLFAVSVKAEINDREHRDLGQLQKELKAALGAELEQMDENGGILKPDKMRKLPYSSGYGYGREYEYGYGYGYGYKGSVSWVQSD